MKETQKSMFDQQYRVVAVEGDRLLVRGILSGEYSQSSAPSMKLLLRKKTTRKEN
jgi:hypothetical protein